MNCEGSPLAGTGMEVPIFHVEIPGAHCLRPQSVEEGDLTARSYTHCKNFIVINRFNKACDLLIKPTAYFTESSVLSKNRSRWQRWRRAILEIADDSAKWPKVAGVDSEQ